MKAGNHNGFVLLEVLLGIVIVSVSLTLIIQSMSASLRVARDSSDYAMALFLLEDKLNEFVHQQKIAADLNESGSFTEPYEKYQYTLTTKQVELVPIPEELNSYVDKMNEVDLEVIFGKKKLALATYLLDQK